MEFIKIIKFQDLEQKQQDKVLFSIRQEVKEEYLAMGIYICADVLAERIETKLKDIIFLTENKRQFFKAVLTPI